LGWVSAYILKVAKSEPTNVEALGHSRKVPYWLNSDLGDGDFARIIDTDLAVRYESTFPYTVLELWHFHVSFRDSDSGSDLHIILVHNILVQPWCEMAIRIHSHNLLLVAPLRKRANLGSGLGVGEVWLVGDVEVLACYSKGIIDGVRASVGANSCDNLAHLGSRREHGIHTITPTDGVWMSRHNNRTTHSRVFGTPFHGQRINASLARIRSQDNL
jgi:hypothetical protein